MKAEVFIISEHQAPPVLQRIVELSEPAMVLSFGEPLAYFGLIPQTLVSDKAYLWVHTLPEVERHKLVFTRESRAIARRMLEHYNVVYGHCFTDSARAWIRWAGAEINENSFIFRRAA